MTDSINFEKLPRADTMRAESDIQEIGLHPFAFEQSEGWLPTNLKRYHKGRTEKARILDLRDSVDKSIPVSKILDDETILMEGYYDEFIPRSEDSDSGRRISKNVQFKTIYCPDCEVAARKVDGETVCPECGLLCHMAGPSHEIIRDGKAAGRTDGYKSD